MIKKISLIALIMLASYEFTSGQVLLSLIFGDNLNTDKVEFGMSAGFNRSYIRGIDGSKGTNNWELGFYFEVNLKEDKPWFASTGVYVKSNVGGQNIPLDYAGNRDIKDSIYNGFEAAHGSVKWSRRWRPGAHLRSR